MRECARNVTANITRVQILTPTNRGATTHAQTIFPRTAWERGYYSAHIQSYTPINRALFTLLLPARSCGYFVIIMVMNQAYKLETPGFDSWDENSSTDAIRHFYFFFTVFTRLYTHFFLVFFIHRHNPAFLFFSAPPLHNYSLFSHFLLTYHTQLLFYYSPLVQYFRASIA